MEIILALSSGFLLGYLIRTYQGPSVFRLPKPHQEFVNLPMEDMNWTGTPEPLGAIIHPVPFAIKREQKLTQEAKERGEDAIEVSKL